MNTKQTEALKLALEAAEVLETLFKQAEAMHEEVTAGVNVHCQITVAGRSKGLYAAAAILEALAEQPAQQQEPVYYQWRRKNMDWDTNLIFNYQVEATTEDSEVRELYTSPPASKPWVGLTDEEILAVARNHYNPHQRAEISFARAIEAKLKEKNT